MVLSLPQTVPPLDGERWPQRRRLIAIVDIGSNSVRLVIYDALLRTPLPIFNEKAVCALGQGLESSGRLNEAGMVLATTAIGRFVRLARAMEVEAVHILATAAVREAADGPAFVATIEAANDVTVQVLSGGEEAKLAALGVLCAVPDANGVVADLGGGSLELAAVSQGVLGKHATLPLGVLRLSEKSGGSRGAAADIVDRALADLKWLGKGRGRALYAVGGAWRAIARLCIAQTAHPILVLDNFTLDRAEAERLLDLVSRQSPKSIEKAPGVPKKRIPTLPMAALVLEKVLQAARPARLVFSVYGMREGKFFRQLPQHLRGEDPLISSCQALAVAAGRFNDHADEIMSWMAPLFPDETPAVRRVRHAASLLGDVFWSEHPDYRAEQAFLRTLRLPFVGIGHQERAVLAVAIYTRYRADGDLPASHGVHSLLDGEAYRMARVMGLALRLCHVLTGGAAGLLPLTRLTAEKKALVLELPDSEPAFRTDLVGRSFERLAKEMGLAPVVRRIT